MDLHLTDKVAVVTGANKGIGLATTEALLAEGARVVAGSRTTANLDGLEGVAATVAKATGVDADTVRAGATAAIASGRFTTPQEVAALITMLASDRLANVTGANYVIDGGLIKTT